MASNLLRMPVLRRPTYRLGLQCRTAKSFSGQRVKCLRRLLPRFIVQVIEVGLLRGFLVGNFAMVLGQIQVH